MKRITSKILLKDLALMIGSIFKEAKIDSVLVGGSVVSIYTNNKYQSYDLAYQ